MLTRRVQKLPDVGIDTGRLGHTWCRLFSRGGKNASKYCYTPKNGSRGGDTFCPPVEWVEGGRGGQTKFLLN